MAAKKTKKKMTPVIQRAVRAIRTGRVAVRAVGEFVRDEIDDLRAKRGSKKRKRRASAGSATRRAATKSRGSRARSGPANRATRSKGRSPARGRKKSSRAKSSSR